MSWLALKRDSQVLSDHYKIVFPADPPYFPFHIVIFTISFVAELHSHFLEHQIFLGKKTEEMDLINTDESLIKSIINVLRK